MEQLADDVKKIAQRIELTGEKEYSAALKEAQRNLRVLRSELKAETAELGKNATEQQKNETRLKNLQKQIKEQEKVVKTYEEALEEVRKKYGDDAEAVAKWEIKLNDARTALANMKNSLNDVGQGMKSVQDSANLGVVATNSLADSLGKVADVGSTISGAIEGAFSSVVDTISGAISELWGQLMDVSARANNWTDIATTWNTSASNIQKWYHAVQAEGKDFAKLSNFVAKIVTADNKKVAESTKVSAVNYSDQWEYAMAVMDELSKMKPNERMDALTGMGISGAKQEGWLDMLNAWNDILENGDNFDTSAGGMGLTDKELAKANELAIAVSKLQESWQALRDHAMVNLFGDLALNITGNIQNVLDAFHEYFTAETDDERAAALAKVKENILEAFRNVKDAIQEGIQLLSSLAEDLKNSDDELAQALGNALGALVDALTWLADSSHWETIKTGIEWLIGIWASAKVATAIGALASFASHIATIKNSGGLLGSLFGNSNKTTPTGDGTTLVPTASSKETTATTTGGLFDRFVQGAGTKVVLDEAVALMNQAKQNIDKLEQLTEENNWDDTERNYWMLTGKAPDKNSKEYQDWEKAFNEIGTSAGRSFGEETSEDKPFGVLTHEQTAAAEEMFDAWKNFRSHIGDSDEDSWTRFDEAWGALEGLFGDNTGTFDTLVDTMEELVNELEENGDLDNMEDLPAEWWNKNELTSEDIKGFNTLPGKMASAVARGVSGIKVQLDGQTVGNLVAPYVSEQIALSIFG